MTGVSGMIGSNIAAAFRDRGWSVVGSYFSTPVSVTGCETIPLELDDRENVVSMIGAQRPDVIVHSAASVGLGAMELDNRLVQRNERATSNTVTAAETSQCAYVLVSSDWVFPGNLQNGDCYLEDDLRAPINAYGRSKAASEVLVETSSIPWLITRPANVYGVNLSTQIDGGSDDARLWQRSSLALQWLGQLLKGKPVLAPESARQCPTSAWSYATRICDLVDHDARGIFNTAGPVSMTRADYLRTLAGIFDLDTELVQSASIRASLEDAHEYPELPIPANTSLSDALLTRQVGAIDTPWVGLRELRSQVEQIVGNDLKGAVLLSSNQP